MLGYAAISRFPVPPSVQIHLEGGVKVRKQDWQSRAMGGGLTLTVLSHPVSYPWPLQG